MTKALDGMAEPQPASGQTIETVEDGASIWIRKLAAIAELPPDDRQALARLPVRGKTYDPDHDIVREGDRPLECAVVLEGFVFRHKSVTEGGRQIMSFHPPGDVP